MKNTTIAAALLACILATGAARAEDPEVEARFEKGVALYKEADFRSAVVEFRRAYDRSKNPKILYNIAQCEYQLTNYVAAQAAFEKYLADGGSDVPATRREDVEGELQKLKARIALVTIKVDKPGAAVTVDEMRVGVSPLPAPVPLNPGAHRIVARLANHADASAPVEVGGGDASTVEIRLVEQTAAAQPAAEGTRERSWTPAIVAWTATGAFTIAAVALGVTAQSKNDELADARNEPNVGRSRLRDLDSQLGTFSVLTDVMIGAAVVSGAIATYFTLARSSSSPPATARTSSRSSFELRPGFRGVALGGAF